MGLVLRIAGGIILAVILLTVGCGVLVSSSSDDIEQELASIEADAEQQVEQEEAEQAERVTWEWVDKPSCSEGTRCWQIEVTSEAGCPNGLYAELNILDADGVVVDYTNDSLGRLGPGGTALLTFEHYGEAASGEVSKVQCS